MIRVLFEYDCWANRESLASLSTVTGDTEKAMSFFSHIIEAQRIWLGRFDDPNPPSAQAWPVLSAEEARQAIEEIHGEWTALLNGLTEQKLDGELVYRNMKGVELRTPLRDVPMHLVMHSVYHRGQMAAAVREAGGKPAATDYVVFARRKLG